MTRYELKKALLRPHSARVRRRLGDLDQMTRAMLDVQYYRRPMIEFMGLTVVNPDILTDARVDSSGVLLDVGAYVGDWAVRARERYGAIVHAFEPSPIAYAELAARSADDAGLVLHRFGLAGATGRATMSLEGPGSTVYGGPGTFGKVEIELRDIIEVLDELGVGEVDVLKVNIEGGEYDLFDRLIDTGELERFRQVSVQFHEWHPDAYRRRAAIRRALARSHHEVWCYPWVWEFWDRGCSSMARGRAS